MLEISDLDVDLGGRPVLRDTQLTARRGELLGVVGPNGAGKTTLLRAILGLVPVRTGRVSLDGRAVDRCRAEISYVPQRHEFIWDYPISVLDAVVTGRSARLGWWRRPRRADWEAAALALERTALLDLAKRQVGELSGGQRQRVLVARALAAEPQVLLLDEPLTGLDLPNHEELLDLCVRLAAEGRVVIMTTHDLLAAAQTCDRLALVNRTVVATGRPEELRDPEPWRTTYGIAGDSPVLRVLKEL